MYRSEFVCGNLTGVAAVHTSNLFAYIQLIVTYLDDYSYSPSVPNPISVAIITRLVPSIMTKKVFIDAGARSS